MSLKIHIVFDHIIQFCRNYDKGLGFFSEQGLESSHYDFHSFWLQSYKVSMNHPNYAEKMLQSVISRLLIEAFFLHNLDDSLILCKIVTKMSENRNGNSQGPAQKKIQVPYHNFYKIELYDQKQCGSLRTQECLNLNRHFKVFNCFVIP